MGFLGNRWIGVFGNFSILYHNAYTNQVFQRLTGKDKRTNNDLQNITQKTKDRATRTPLKPGVNSGAPEEVAVPAPYVTAVVLLFNNLVAIQYL